MSPRSISRRGAARAAALLLVGAAAAAGACTEVTTDAGAAVSLTFDSLPAPSLVEGDTLRNVDGVATPLTARAFNVDGDPIEDAPITFTVIPPDTQEVWRTAITVSPDNYLVATGSALASTRTWRVVAQTGALQTRPTARTSVTIVLRPDSLEPVAPTGSDTLLIYNFPDSTSAASRRGVNVRVKLLHDSLAADVNTPVGVGPYLVRFTVDTAARAAAVLDSVRFINGTRREITTVVATGTDGVATARVQAFPKAGQTAPDTIGVLATARRRPAPTDGTADPDTVGGSPVRLLVPMGAVTVGTP